MGGLCGVSKKHDNHEEVQRPRAQQTVDIGTVMLTINIREEMR